MLKSTARIRLIQFAHNHGSREIHQAFLDEAEFITASRIGFFHYLDEDQQTLCKQMWSTNTMESMYEMEGLDPNYPAEMAGAWDLELDLLAFDRRLYPAG